MRLTILLVAVLTVTLTFSKAKADDAIWGAGIDSCGKWIDAHAETGQSIDYTEWVLGYITAVMRSSGGNFTGDVDFPSMRAFINSWCGDNPFKDVEDATQALIRYLKKRDGW